MVGLLEERELVARQRVEELREEADRIQAALQEAETDWERWVIARERVDQVLAAPCEVGPGQATGAATTAAPKSRTGAVPGSVVPVRREGLEVAVLAVDYQRITNIVADHERTAAGPVSCQQIADALGLDPVPAKVEGVRSKAKRLVQRGWFRDHSIGTPVRSTSPVIGTTTASQIAHHSPSPTHDQRQQANSPSTTNPPRSAGFGVVDRAGPLFTGVIFLADRLGFGEVVDARRRTTSMRWERV
ncbi:hypothetical protein NGB36_03830 [Streptomyces sp. RB6PN25]|uniref:Uncharacterized protein n=1 Tax=Streptomyces humicola TaxID=2953240 RepID=A0ABT1PPZ4_9ACTN|nr:hypothetical protein [Streptomyces humicola]MCQ4079744.1 hypothetical protein [Streptomyces humicola]